MVSERSVVKGLFRFAVAALLGVSFVLADGGEGTDPGDTPDNATDISSDNDNSRSSSDTWSAKWAYCAWALHDEDDELLADGEILYDEEGRLDTSVQEVHSSKFAAISDRRVEAVFYEDKTVELRQFFDLAGNSDPHAARLSFDPDTNFTLLEVEDETGDFEPVLVSLYTGSPSNVLTGFGGTGVEVGFGVSSADDMYELTVEEGDVVEIVPRDDVDAAFAHISGEASISYGKNGYFEQIVIEDGEGQVVQEESFDYDENDRLIRRESVYESIPFDRIVTTYEYDCEG